MEEPWLLIWTGDKIENFCDTEMVKTNYLAIVSREDVIINKVGS